MLMEGTLELVHTKGVFRINSVHFNEVLPSFTNVTQVCRERESPMSADTL